MPASLSIRCSLALLLSGLLSPAAAQQELTPPTSVHVVETGLRKITLAWAPSPGPGVAGYVVYRQDSPGEPFNEVATLRGWQSGRYTDDGKVFHRLKDSALYAYAVAAFASDGHISAPSPAVSALTLGPPAPVSGLEARAGPRRILLRWRASPELEVTGYRIWRASRRDSEYSRIGTRHRREDATFTDQGLDDLSAFHYMVTAVNAKGVESEPCQPLAARTLAPPLTPSGLVATSNSTDRILLSWSPNPEPNLGHYEILRSTKADRGYKIAGKAAPRDTRFVDLQVEPGTLYFYSLVAVDLDRLQSPPCPPVRAFTRSPPIAPTALSARLGSEGLVLEWTRSPDPNTSGYLIHQKYRYAWRVVGRTSDTHFLVEGLTSDAIHRFRVSAFLTNGLESQPSETLKIDLKRPPAADGTVAIVRSPVNDP